MSKATVKKESKWCEPHFYSIKIMSCDEIGNATYTKELHLTDLHDDITMEYFGRLYREFKKDLEALSKGQEATDANPVKG